MKCEWVRGNITLQVYGELADDARHELEQHVARCEDCAAELKSAQEFHALLSQDRVNEPSPILLAASRMRLQEALEKLTPRERMVFELKHYHGLKLRTVGEILHTTEETAKNTLFRATQKLRGQLADMR